MPGPLIYFALRGDDIAMDQGERIFADLWPAYMQFHYLIKGEKTNMNPLREGLSLATSLHMAIDGFRRLVPKQFQFNIDREHADGSYHFTLFRFCEGWGTFWHALEVGPALQVLARKNKPLHDLFLSFIRLFSNATGVPLWDDGAMGNCLESLDERILNNDDDDPVAFESMTEDIEIYQKGIAAEYARRIHRAKRMTASEVKRRAARFRSPIANLIYQGCDLLTDPNRIFDFNYLDGDYEDAYYLKLDCQANVIWQTDDNLFYEYSSYLDAMAREGVQDPAISLTVDKNLKRFDANELLAKDAWVRQLSNYFTRAYEITEKFKKDERVNGVAPKKSPCQTAHSRLCC